MLTSSAGIITLLMIIPSAFAGKIKYEVRLQRPDWSRTTRSRTLNMPDRHLDLISDNMRTWSSQRFNAYIGTHGDMVIVNNVNAINYDIAAADAMINEMALVVMCNVPGSSDAQSIASFDRRKDCKKRRTHN